MATARVRLLLPFAAFLALVNGCASSGLDANDAAGTNNLAGATGGSTATAGTSSNPASGSGGTSSGTAGTSPNGNAGATNDTGSAGATAAAPYANVTAVATSGSDGDYTFNVTIESSDIDCSQFADWWEVLSEDGTLLYRRILDHSHTDANGTADPDAPGNTFTRSGGPVPVAASDVVLVRAHMSVGGYNGQVMRGSVTNGFADAPEIGGDFAVDIERASPQPTGCEF